MKLSDWWEDPVIWSDNKRAQELGREKKHLEGLVVTLELIGQQLKDAFELLPDGKRGK